MPYFEASAKLGRNKSTSANFESKSNLLNFTVGLGLAVRLGKRVTFDTQLAYDFFFNKKTR